MFGIGFSEMAIIALVVMVLVRPEDLPAFFRKLGKFYGQLKRAYQEMISVKDQFIREMDIAAALQEAESPKPAEEAKQISADLIPETQASPAPDESAVEDMPAVQE
jgi:Sec-independent protein translocase protein TatA